MNHAISQFSISFWSNYSKKSHKLIYPASLATYRPSPDIEVGVIAATFLDFFRCKHCPRWDSHPPSSLQRQMYSIPVKPKAFLPGIRCSQEMLNPNQSQSTQDLDISSVAADMLPFRGIFRCQIYLQKNGMKSKRHKLLPEFRLLYK